MRQSLLVLLVFTAACEPLVGVPATPLQVDFVSTGELVLSQRVTPIRLEYTVKGCETFRVFASLGEGEIQTRVLLTPESTSQDSFVSVVPAEVLKPHLVSCTGPALASPGELTSIALEVECDQDGRSVRGAPRPLRYQVADRFVETAGPVEAVFSLSAPGTFAALDSYADLLSTEVSASINSFSKDGRMISLRPLLEPFRHNTWFKELAPQSYYFELGADYQAVPIGSGQTAYVGTSLLKVWAEETSTVPAQGWAPGSPVDVVREGGNTLLASSFSGQVEYAFFSTVVPTSALKVTTTINAVVTGEHPVSHAVSLDGRPAVFFSVNGSDQLLRVRRFDGSLVREVQLAGSGPLTSVAVTDDAAKWAYIRNDTLYVQSFAGFASPSGVPSLDWSELTWLTTGSLIVSSTYHYQTELHLHPGLLEGQGITLLARPGERSQPPVVKVQPLRDGAFAVLTGSGVQLFDSTGELKVGADPLPTACAQSLRSEHMVAVDDDSVAVGVSKGALIFTLPR